MSKRMQVKSCVYKMCLKDWPFFPNSVAVLVRGSYLSQELLPWKLQTDRLLGTGTLSWTSILPQHTCAGLLFSSAVQRLCCVSWSVGVFFGRWTVRATLANFGGHQKANHMAKTRCSHDSHQHDSDHVCR